MTQFRSSPFSNIPEVTKNLLIINAVLFLATLLFDGLQTKLGLYYFHSKFFQPFQIVTHMFTHGSFAHIFFNMFALFSFGAILERVWGPKKFLLFYLITGFGAMGLHMLVNHIQAELYTKDVSPEMLQQIWDQGRDLLYTERNYTGVEGKLNLIYNIPTVGASGAIYGLLIAFGMMFPNSVLMLIFPPIPVKAKYMIPILVVIELFLGTMNLSGDNIAHFAHLGGALFGYILVKIWKTNRTDIF